MFKLLFNQLYPAYATFKAFRSKRADEYVKWMMYWIVFAIFTFFETFTDVLFFWLPFYDEVKTLTLFWLIVPVWKGLLGSGVIYKKLVHPFLLSNEAEIDRFIHKLTGRALNLIKNLASQAVRFVSDTVLNFAVAEMITPQLASAVPDQNLIVLSSDSEGDEQKKLAKNKTKSLKKRNIRKKK